MVKKKKKKHLKQYKLIDGVPNDKSYHLWLLDLQPTGSHSF